MYFCILLPNQMVDSEENHLLPYGPIDEVDFEDIAITTGRKSI